MKRSKKRTANQFILFTNGRTNEGKKARNEIVNNLNKEYGKPLVKAILHRNAVINCLMAKKWKILKEQKKKKKRKGKNEDSDEDSD